MYYFSSFLQVLHDTIMLLTYLASFTGYGDDYFKVISNLHVQSLKFEGIFWQIWQKIFLKINSMEFVEFVYSESASFIIGPLI